MLLRYLTAYRWSIAVVTAVATASALFFSYRAPPVYEATSMVLVEPVIPVSDEGAFIPPPNLSTEARLASSLPVAERVASTLGSSERITDLLDRLTVEAVPQTEILAFRYEAEDPAAAARGADAFAEQYLRARERKVAGDVVAAVNALQEHIAAIEGELVRLSEEIEETSTASLRSILRSRADLLSNLLVDKQLDVLRIQGELQGGQIVQSAEEPSEPIRPNHRSNALLGLVLGLLLGIGQAMLRGRVSRIWSVEELEAVTGAPLLGAIPSMRWRTRRRTRPLLNDPRTPRSIVEAFRSIRENVTAAVPRGTVLIVTSAEPSEGKSLVAVNLAIALTRGGKRTVLVSADPSGSIDRLLEVSGRSGLVEALSGSTPLPDVVITDASGLRVLPRGRGNGAPIELAGPTSRDVLQELAQDADLIIVDSPPMAGSADTVSLAAFAYGAVLVVDAERADPGPLRSARRQLEQVGLLLVGSVLTGADLGELEARSYRRPMESPRVVSEDASGDGRTRSGSPARRA